MLGIVFVKTEDVSDRFPYGVDPKGFQLIGYGFREISEAAIGICFPKPSVFKFFSITHQPVSTLNLTHGDFSWNTGPESKSSAIDIHTFELTVAS